MNNSVHDVSFPLTEEACKKLVFAHWDFLQNLARRRFPNDDNTAHLALDHVLESLQEKQWHRVRMWEGQGKFATFLSVLAARLMTDYIRKLYGHQRPPKWLRAQDDPLWMEAYQALIIERLSRQEAFHLLQTRHPELGSDTLREVLAEVVVRCPPRNRYQDNLSVPLEEIGEPGSEQLSPEAGLESHPRELLEALDGYIRGDDPLIPEAQRLVERLRPHLNLDENDRLLLRLRFCEGLGMNQIAKLLHMKGDPYKRLNKILKTLRTACEKAHLTDIQEGVSK